MKSLKNLRHLLRVEVMEQPPSDFIDMEPEPKVICKVWGYVATLTDSQRLQSSLAERIISHKITTRWDPRIPTDWQNMRLIDETHEDRQYNVTGFINIDELDERIEFEALESR